jgi:recombination protein RecA
LAVAANVVNRSGSWFKYGETYLGQGKEKARLHLIENPAITEELRSKVMSANDELPPVMADEGAVSEDLE